MARVAIIGQSNAILGTGFAAHLKAQPGIEISGMQRLGATPSVMLPMFAGPTWLEEHDVCIIDVAVSDSVFLWTDAIDPVSIGQYVTYAIQMAHAAGCLPLVLIIPHRAMLPDPAGPLTVPFLHQIYRAAAAQNGAMLLDLTGPLHALGRTSPELLDAAYSDVNHLSDSFSREVAVRLAALIDEATNTAIERRSTIGAIPNYFRTFLTALAPDAPTIRRESSIYVRDFVVLGAGDRLELPTGQLDRLHGLLINRARSNAKLKIEGSSTIIKALGTRSERNLPLVAQVTPLLAPMHDRSGVLTLSIAEPRTPVTEPSWNPLGRQAHHLEIGEILYHRGWRRLDYGVPILPHRLAEPNWAG